MFVRAREEKNRQEVEINNGSEKTFHIVDAARFVG
jgi:hypothetical protein